MSEQQLRIGDIEREQAAATLGEHFAQGRLSVDEHAERLDRIWSSRTRGELMPVFADLPETHQHQDGVRRERRGYWSPGPWARRGGLPAPLVVVLAVLIAMTVLTHLPFVIFGAFVWFFVASRHRRWHAQRRDFARW